MGTRKARLVTVPAAALVFIMAACDGKPPLQPTPISRPPSGPVGVELELNGPASIAPGQSAQYSLLQRLSDGSTRSVTAARWNSSVPSIVQVSESGLATAAPLTGFTILQAQVTDPAATGPRLATREILVLPDGTFRLVGTVREAASNGFPVAGARLEARVTADLSAPLVSFATTNEEGTYRLYGVPGDTFIHIRKSGYRSATIPVPLGGHGTRSFDLELDSPRLSVAGDYTMTVEAGGSCAFSKPLPNELRRRSYAANIDQDGPRLTVTLSGAAFAVAKGSGNRFSGIAAQSSAHVELRTFRNYYYYRTAPEYPDVVEALPDGTVLEVTGQATLSQTPSGFSGNLSGSIRQYSGSTFPSVTYLTGCAATRLTLTRQ